MVYKSYLVRHDYSLSPESRLWHHIKQIDGNEGMPYGISPEAYAMDTE